MRKGGGGRGSAASKQQEEDKCSVCRENATKYHCPADRAGYCSVPCFKKHKAESCAAAPNTQSIPTKRSVHTQDQDVSSRSEKARKTDSDLPEEEPPMVALSDLQWPPNPLEEGPNALQDPLNRDEPKPLLHSDLMAIATSIPMRQLLSTHPFLKDLLTNISRIPNAPPKFPQSIRVRNILGLGEAHGVPDRLNYRPKEDERNGRSFGHGPAYIDPEETKALQKFGDLVKSILAEERQKRETLQS